VQLGNRRPGRAPRLAIACTGVIDSAWVTSRRVPARGRRITMTSSRHLDPDI
jgi:hypothetical protein